MTFFGQGELAVGDQAAVDGRVGPLQGAARDAPHHHYRLLFTLSRRVCRQVY